MGNIKEVAMTEKLRVLYNAINWSLANQLKLEEFLKKLKEGKI